ncbi:YeeE/YedE family protein [Paraburkholderia azotifigens]|uniref:YeeE/YedE family protein n=2 Tax=Paraburkholderia azotifigens TaxID=2057004 RepID=A0A5C6V5X2_9BURK|nr:YeeE/YedE family protein [Paraburkholderia azotifigens]TXC79961.1 YeeE/YedE family protein [Paraburkholderia azotifigens]
MSIEMGNFTPGFSPAGGLIIGAAAAVLILFNGRIAGISGIPCGLPGATREAAGWRAAFIAGLIAAPGLARMLGKPVMPDIQAGWGELIVAGFLVGIGARSVNARVFVAAMPGGMTAFEWLERSQQTRQEI